MLASFYPDNLKVELERMIISGDLADKDVDIAKELVTYLSQKCVAAHNKAEIGFTSLETFWPPRLSKAIREGKSVIFFGAGLSVSCGIPGWNKLLAEYFGVEKGMLEDEDLQSDPLTLAELACQRIGHEALQTTLREVTTRVKKYSVNHVLLAALRCPIYITTNYDSLFEDAWRALNRSDIPVILNDTDLAKSEVRKALSAKTGVLFKIHGSVARKDELLILTRKDYRTHYRLNDSFFKNLKSILRENHILFLGFSHKDPEVSRLVEDIIYEFENRLAPFANKNERPHFFSLQFDMRSHTPEVFAARGFVALRPPSIQGAIETIRTQHLGVALCDLVTIKSHKADPDVSIYDNLSSIKDELSNDIQHVIDRIKNCNDSAIEYLDNISNDESWLKQLTSDLKPFASQGVYLTNDQGRVVAFDTPPGIPKKFRSTTFDFSKRPYFHQAKSFRDTFISDSAKSVFNGQSTLFVCTPVLKQDKMIGLLFSAFQIGQWEKPVAIATNLWARGWSFLLIDSNGTCLVPPFGEFTLSCVNESDGTISVDVKANEGYEYNKLLSISYRDAVVKHIGNSVIPISLDDDVITFSNDYKQYSVISEIKNTRWKIALSIPITR